MNEKEITETLKGCNTVREGHFVGTSGLHLDHYFDKNRLLAYPETLERLTEELAARCTGEGIIEVVVSPTLADAFVGQRMAYYLGRYQNRTVHFVVAEKNKKGDGFEIGRGQQAFMRQGAKALVVVDVFTTGGSAKSAVKLACAGGLDVVAAAGICHRGRATAESVGVPKLISLVSFNWPSWAATEDDPCPCCLDNVRFDTDVGHAKDYLEKLDKQGRLELWMTDNQYGVSENNHPIPLGGQHTLLTTPAVSDTETFHTLGGKTIEVPIDGKPPILPAGPTVGRPNTTFSDPSGEGSSDKDERWHSER